MKILIDTNVILDVLFDRPQFIGDSITVLHMCEDGFAKGMVTAKAVADIYYFVRKQLRSEAKARAVLRKLMTLVSVCDVGAERITEALDTENGDYEDAIMAACAKAEGCSLIITRNKKHFTGTGVKCLTPEEFVI
ncbi:MAG: PIN domain-containing protein [Firmicutes bacterium]|nr:PIN domain-containing protein [Bacillota bacterium]